MSLTLRWVVRRQEDALSYPWGKGGLDNAKASQIRAGGVLALGVYAESGAGTIDHRLDFDLQTGRELVDPPDKENPP